jgi:hypothetical protein
MRAWIIRLLVAGVAGTCAVGASAAPVVFFGENTVAPGTIGAAPAAARAAFLANLTGVGSEDFESFADNTPAPLNITFPGSTGSITATITGQGQIQDSPGAGRFNTSPGGSKYWEVSGTFVINFSDPISAFGFYGTDIGDFNGRVTVALLDTNNDVTNLIIQNTQNGPNGSALFWGFIDTASAYTRITFGNTAAGVDFFGFDVFVIGDRQQVTPVPEPGTLALVALGMLAALRAGRRRQG